MNPDPSHDTRWLSGNITEWPVREREREGGREGEKERERERGGGERERKEKEGSITYPRPPLLSDMSRVTNTFQLGTLVLQLDRSAVLCRYTGPLPHHYTGTLRLPGGEVSLGRFPLLPSKERVKDEYMYTYALSEV